MVSKEVVISNQVGLHARPATFFIQKANEYKCSIHTQNTNVLMDAYNDIAKAYAKNNAILQDVK